MKFNETIKLSIHQKQKKIYTQWNRSKPNLVRTG